MSFRNVVWPALLAASFLLHLFVAEAAPKPVLAYYMPWFVAKPFSSTWGWHWTMNHYDPEVVNAFGERQIASWYYPLIGPYDSADPVVLEYHVLLMKLAGIDGVMVDWYGADNYYDYAINNERTRALLEYTRRARLKFCLCYEDQTIQQEIQGGFITATGAVAHAQKTMLYLHTNYFGDPSFLQWSNRPVLLNFGPQFFKSSAQWQDIFSVLPSAQRPAFFTEDDCVAPAIGAFNWPPMWLSQAPGTGGVLSDTALQQYLSKFEQKAASWPAFISSAFPRFHDIYKPAGVRDYWGYLGDNNGQVLRATLSRAMTNASTYVQIVTWNDFGEGTVVEPTREYGYRDLGIIQDLRRQYLDPAFAHHTNDLTLATRVHNLRRQNGNDTNLSAALDQVFTTIIDGNLKAASRRLTELESKSTQERNANLR
jgi:hypothetical protein